MITPQPLRTALPAILLACLTLWHAGADAAEWIYTVQRGDNPWSLTARYLNGVQYWPRLQRLNRITDPEHIPPGTRLRIPIEWLRRVDAVAKVIALHGDATLAGRRASRPLARGMQLRSGDVIRTARDANVTLEFADGSRVLVHAEAELRLDALGAFDNTDYFDTSLHLARGRMENLVTPLGQGPGRFEISTPAAVTAVRGTDYRVNAGETDTQTRSEVLAGQVQVRNDSAGVELGAGQGTVASATAAPSAPVALLPGPALAGRPARVERVPLSFTVDALPGAVAYRLQIASDPSFASLLFDGRSDSARLRAGDVPDGHYLLRVRGIDSRGLEGHNTDHAFELDARPEPPLLSTPTPGGGVPEERPTFTWGASTAISHYHLQVARDEAFTELLMDDATLQAAQASTPDALPPGSYFWRVASIDAREGQGPYSDVQRFRRLPPAPAMEEPAVDEQHMNVRWRAGEAGETFQFQLAADESFATPVIDMKVDTSAAQFDRPKGGSYYMRVKTLYADGVEGAYGTPQRIEVPSSGARRWWLLLLLPLIGLAL